MSGNQPIAKVKNEKKTLFQRKTGVTILSTAKRVPRREK